MNKHNETTNANGPAPADAPAKCPWFAKPWVLISMIVLAMGSVFGMLVGAAWYSEQPRQGTLVLTLEGCQVLNFHGLKVEPLDQGLCAFQARYRDVRGSKPPRMLVRDENGVQVEFLASEVLSRGSGTD